MNYREEFISQNKNLAQRVTSGSGIFWEVLLAQAITESSGLSSSGHYRPGESLLAKKYNNYFGIKASAQWKGPTVTLKTREGSSTITTGIFRVYPNREASFIDYVNFLKSNPRYQRAGVFTAKNPNDQIKKIAQAGYATDPNYQTVLTSVLNTIQNFKDPVNFGAIILLLVSTALLIK